METVEDVTQLRLVGGDPALDFLNSRSGPPDGPADVDALTSYAALVEWCVYSGTLSRDEGAALLETARSDPEEAGRVHERALRLRDDLDEVFRALAHRRVPSRDALDRVRDEEAESIRCATLVPDERPRWSWGDDRTLARPLRPVVHAAVHLLTDGPVGRVKQCGGCSFVFVDESKNRSRRWCSMEDCGTAEKMRRYVATRRARAAETRPAPVRPAP